MTIPLFKEAKIGLYVLKQKLSGRERYPLVLMLEPLFRCNLACVGCGKIDYPDAILNQRLSTQECLDAVDECGAPMVAIPGGEPLIHRDIGDIVKGIVARKKFVSLCTNALLLEKKLHLFEPSPYLFFSVHLETGHELDLAFVVGHASGLGAKDGQPFPLGLLSPLPGARLVEGRMPFGVQRALEVGHVAQDVRRVAGAHERLGCLGQALAGQDGTATFSQGQARAARTGIVLVHMPPLV